MTLTLALAPLAAIMIVVIKLDSRGSAFFCQQRVGLHGRPFTIYKFRSMTANADALLDDQGRVQATRITRVGRLLRQLSPDELPQLLNIRLG